MKPADPKTQEPIRAWAVVCSNGTIRLHEHKQAALREGTGIDADASECGPHRVVELREVRDGEK